MPGLAELVGTVPELSGRVHSAGKLSALMARNQLAQVCPAAFVLPLGFRGGAASAATGLYRQEMEWLEGVVLVLRFAGDATGAAALVELKPLIPAVLAAVAGCEAENGFGVFRPTRGELVTLQAGTLTYQIDFAIDDQMRIPR